MGEQERLGAQRASVFEGELQRLRERNSLHLRYINHQGKAIQAIGDALSAFVTEERKERRALECRIARLELPFWRRWALSVRDYCWPVWVRVVEGTAPVRFEGQALEVDPDEAKAADIAALVKMLGTSVLPQPGDEALIEDEYKQAIKDIAAGGQSENEFERAMKEHAEQALEPSGNGGDPSKVRPFRGKVMMGLLLTMLLPWPVRAQGAIFVSPGVFHGCGLKGDAKHEREQSGNLQKNRSAVPDPAAIQDIEFGALYLLTTHLHATTPVRFTAFVARVKPGGSESVNCHAKDPALLDTHIELIPTTATNGVMAVPSGRFVSVVLPDGHKLLPVVVEVTPRFREAMKAVGADWSTATLEKTLTGHIVQFEGWPFDDVEHANAAELTHPGGLHNWRETTIEPCHPCTSIKVIR